MIVFCPIGLITKCCVKNWVSISPQSQQKHLMISRKLIRENKRRSKWDKLMQQEPFIWCIELGGVKSIRYFAKYVPSCNDSDNTFWNEIYHCIIFNIILLEASAIFLLDIYTNKQLWFIINIMKPSASSFSYHILLKTISSNVKPISSIFIQHIRIINSSNVWYCLELGNLFTIVELLPSPRLSSKATNP